MYLSAVHDIAGTIQKGEWRILISASAVSVISKIWKIKKKKRFKVTQIQQNYHWFAYWNWNYCKLEHLNHIAILKSRNNVPSSRLVTYVKMQAWDF